MRFSLIFLFLLTGSLHAQPFPFTGDISLVMNTLPEPFAYDTAWVSDKKIKNISWTNFEANRKGKLINKSAWNKGMEFDEQGRLISLDETSRTLGLIAYRFNYRGDNGCPLKEGGAEFNFGCDGMGRLTLIRGPVDTSEFIYNDRRQVVQEIYRGEQVPYTADYEINSMSYDEQGRMTEYLKQDARSVVNATEGGMDTLICDVTRIKYTYEDQFLKRVTSYFAETEFNRAFPNRFDTTSVTLVYTELQNNGNRLTSATFYYPEGDKGYTDFVYSDEGLIEEVQYYSIDRKGMKVWNAMVFMEYVLYE